MATTRGSGGTSGGRDWQEVSPRYRQAWEGGPPPSGSRWEDSEPGYRYVHEMGTDPRFEGRRWNDVESDLQSGYSGWAQQRGVKGNWNQVRSNVREAWEGNNQNLIQLREEELTARKRMVQTGEVEIRKDVVAEQKTIEVPVTREEVTIERHAVDRRPAEGTIGSNEVIEVPIREEQVEVQKQAVVYEELEVGKRAVQETETVTDTVRREVADVRTEGDVERDTGPSTRR